MKPRFKKLNDAFYRMMGRADMSLRLGMNRRATIQTLAAARLLKLATKTTP